MDETKKPKNRLSLFDSEGDNILQLKPLTKGLGFKDRVAMNQNQEEVERDKIHLKANQSADAGELEIGNGEPSDHGTLSIYDNEEINLTGQEEVAPILFHSGHDSLIKKTAKKSGESLVGVLIDILFSFALTILIVAVGVEVEVLTLNFDALLQGNQMEAGRVFIILSAIFISYKVLARAFFGKTLGEWSSRHQLGLYSDQDSFFYIFQVLIREVFTFVSGIILFPVLTLLFKRDVGYYFSGLQTYIEYKKLRAQ